MRLFCALVPRSCTVDRCGGRMTVHRQGADVQRRFDDVAGRVLLRLAVVLHRAVAGGTARERWQQRRNIVLRAAFRRGVTVPELAGRLGLSEGWVRQVLNGRRPAEPPVVGEAA